MGTAADADVVVAGVLDVAAWVLDVVLLLELLPQAATPSATTASTGTAERRRKKRGMRIS